MQKAREHASKSEDDMNAAGQHAASAASTVGHDLRAAGQQAADAAKYVGQRYCCPSAPTHCTSASCSSSLACTIVIQ